VLAAALAALPGTGALAAHAVRRGRRGTPGPEYSTSEIVVGYSPAWSPSRDAFAAERAPEAEASTALRGVPRGSSVAAELRRVRAERGVEWAVPDYIAHIAAGPYGEFIPNDRGRGKQAGDWRELQWNFVGEFGVHAPEAWANLNHDGHPGGQGVTVAVLDTGVAYADRGSFRRSPDFDRFQFVKGWDFVAKDPYPYDRNGHGTFVAATIAEETDNGYGLTGLAYGARIMPVRVLDAQGEGEATTIAKGVYFAVRHGAQVINLSLEFSPGVTASDIPELIQALRFAHRHNVLVVAAAGNEGHRAIAYPARAPFVVSVGATTEHGCLAAYSNDGSGLTLVAPGGGPDANLPGDPNCHPELPSGRDVFQVTLTGEGPRSFGIPTGYEGTSMATPHVAAAAALVIASGVLGPHPTPAAITARLRETARKLGGGGDEARYGAGLLDAGAATDPGGPGAVAVPVASG
jgi:serine protease